MQNAIFDSYLLELDHGYLDVPTTPAPTAQNFLDAFDDSGSAFITALALDVSVAQGRYVGSAEVDEIIEEALWVASRTGGENARDAFATEFMRVVWQHGRKSSTKASELIDEAIARESAREAAYSRCSRIVK